MDDGEFALLLDGLFKMHSFKRLIYKNNVFLEQSLLAIQPIFHRRPPNNLRRLRLVNLNTNPKVIEDLLEFMIDF